MAGFPAAKRERRHHKKVSSSSPPDSKMNTEPSMTSSSMEMSDGDTFSDDQDTESINKKSTESPQSSPLGIQPLTPSSTSSSSVECATETNLSFKKKAANVKEKVVQKPSRVNKEPLLKKKKITNIKPVHTEVPNNCQLPAVLQQLDDSIRSSKSIRKYLLPDSIQDCESDDEDQVSYCRLPDRHLSIGSGSLNRNSQLTQKKTEVRRRYLQLIKAMDVEQKYLGQRQSLLAGKLLDAARCCPDETGLLLQGRRLSGGTYIIEFII